MSCSRLITVSHLWPLAARHNRAHLIRRRYAIIFSTVHHDRLVTDSTLVALGRLVTDSILVPFLAAAAAAAVEVTVRAIAVAPAPAQPLDHQIDLQTLLN